MEERQAQIIVLIRAIEESDPEGEILPQRERVTASRRAMMVTGLTGERGESSAVWRLRAGEAVLRRAHQLFEVLSRRHPGIPGILRLAQLGVSTQPVLVGLALLVGLLTNALGPERRINLLSFPLLGLLAWNLVMYLVLLVGALQRRGGARPVDRCAHFLCDTLFRGALRRRLSSSRAVEPRGSAGSRTLTRAVTRFGALWHRLASPLMAARFRRMLHLCAIAMMVGVVLGMYVRGFAFEYRATWESTWLEAAGIQVLLDTLLGPAAAVLGFAVPDVAPLRGPEGSGDAAVWIHLYAMTAVLFVVVPRTLLMLLEGWRSMRLAARLPLNLNDVYYRRLFSAWRGGRRQVTIAPYSFTPSPGSIATLKTLLFDYFGARADVKIREPLVYGGEADAWVPVPDEVDPEGPDRLESCLVVLFNMAQTPESEVHGRLLHDLTDNLDRRRDQLLVVLDSSAYRALRPGAERLGEREQAWMRVVREAGLESVLLDRGGTAGEKIGVGDGYDLMGSVRDALWPRGDRAVPT